MGHRAKNSIMVIQADIGTRKLRLRRFFLVGWLTSFWLAFSFTELALSATAAITTLPLKSSLRDACPADLESLTALLLRDLPGYANRASRRSSRLNSPTHVSSSFIMAGSPEFEPLTLGPGQHTSADSAAVPEDLKQVFFTTLERQYAENKVFEFQQYHWLFLTQTASGWRLAMMFSRIGSYPAKNPPSPPRDSSNGVVGQAVRAWLRDCRAGSIQPLPSPPQGVSSVSASGHNKRTAMIAKPTAAIAFTNLAGNS